MSEYKVAEGSLQDRFLNSRAKVRIYGGGYGNGKTSGACILTLQVAKDYPGANILLARSTYPKLNDTLRKEFLKWCPEHWIKSFPMSAGGTNTCTLKNGTTINFRYIAQQGKSGESTTSNLLSATYDLIVVDQMEDPEIAKKDFDDLLGRLRGNAPYRGDDSTMPTSGPRWFVITLNPTRNWCYRYLVKPLHDYFRGVKNEDLIVDRETGKPIIELFEGSTYENKDNLPEDFIRTLENTYRGQMRDRYLLGLWASYEGLVYPQFSEDIHVLPKQDIRQYWEDLMRDRMVPTVLEGYDHGLAVPCCYLVGFVDFRGNVFICDGFYGISDEHTVEHMAEWIKELRLTWSIPEDNMVLADPSLFRRGPGGAKVVGQTVAGLFDDEGVPMERANNAVLNGITKIQSYLSVHQFHDHPITSMPGAPYLYIGDNVEFLINEFHGYFWKRDSQGEQEERPNDKDDHALDTLRYILSRRPQVGRVIDYQRHALPSYMTWKEYETVENTRSHRYG